MRLSDQPTVLREVRPSVCLRDGPRGLEQLVQVTVHHGGDTTLSAALVLGGSPEVSVSLPAGLSTHDSYLPPAAVLENLLCELRVDGRTVHRLETPRQPPRRWVVHVVQASHHDVGYTDLPSHVLALHDRWLAQVLEHAAATRDYPEDARFRVTIEQAWSLDHYLRHAAPGHAREMLRLVREGQVEITALFGNLTTELCGHETLMRALYPSARLARRAGVEIVSAEHNDIPGFAWGLAEVLAAAGVKLLCAGLPHYYSWGGGGLPSFWDEAAVLGTRAPSGAFWWEAPSGRRILFWYGGAGCSGGFRPSLPRLAERLANLEQDGYAWDVIRWRVTGADCDNPPYIPGYADTIREWNRTWAWPRLVCSTNARFHAGFIARADVAGLPVRRGDLPGQDYPVGACSTARATAVNCVNHAAWPAAEALATAAAALTGAPERAASLEAAGEEILWHDEHTWGLHFPSGAACEAHTLEKALHAHRAAALIQDVQQKSLAAVADAVQLGGEGLHLVVWNSLPRPRTDLVEAPLRETDNCGLELMAVPPSQDSGGGCLKSVLLGNRKHIHPPPEIVDGAFDLVDVATGRTVPCQITELDSPLAAAPYAAERLGLGGGGRRLGLFETPQGLTRTLEFLAADVPALGYRTYRFVPRPGAPDGRLARRPEAGTVIQNEYYRVEIDATRGTLASLLDKQTGREWIRPAFPHGFAGIIVRAPDGAEQVAQPCGAPQVRRGGVRQCVTWRLSAPGHPRIEMSVFLTAGRPRVELAVHALHDPTPLTETYLAFPFNLPGARFTTEETLRVADPESARLPGAFLNRLALQGGLEAAGAGGRVWWSSLDAPIVSLGGLWPNRVSPAHACLPARTLADPPPGAGALRDGTVYSLLFANNFGTNFAVSQCGAVLFRYAFEVSAGAPDPAAAGRFGEDAHVPLAPLFTLPGGERHLPLAGRFLEITPPGVRLLALKPATHGPGLIVRLWNPAPDESRVHLDFAGLVLRAVRRTTATEADTPEELSCGPHGFSCRVSGGEVLTLRMVLRRFRSKRQGEPRSLPAQGGIRPGLSH